MANIISSWRIHNVLFPYDRTKTLLSKVTDKLKTYLVPSWFAHFLENQMAVKKFAEVDDGDGKFRSCDGVCFQNWQIVTPETISSCNKPIVPDNPSDEHDLPNDGVQSNLDPPKPEPLIDTNSSMNNVDLHQSEELGNTGATSYRSDKFLEYLMDPYGDPMSVMAIYDHYSGICNNRQYGQECARLEPNKDRLQKPISSCRPNTKKARHDYFTTHSMTGKSRANVFKLAAKKRRAKQSGNAFVVSRRKMKARLLVNNETPVISTFSKSIMKIWNKINPPLSAYRKQVCVKKDQTTLNNMSTVTSDEKDTPTDEEVSGCELTQEQAPGKAADSILRSASSFSSSITVAGSLQDNVISSSSETRTNNNDDDNDNTDDNHNDEGHPIHRETNSISPEMSREESFELEINLSVQEMHKEESSHFESNVILPEILTEESVEVEENLICHEMPKEDSIISEQNPVLPEISKKESAVLGANLVLPDMPREESITPKPNAIMSEMGNSSGKNMSDQMKFADPSTPTTSLPYLPPSYSNTTHTLVTAQSRLTANLLTFSITNSPPVSTQPPTISSEIKFIIPSETKDSTKTLKQPLQSLPELSEFTGTQLSNSRRESPMDWCELTPPATPMELPPSNSSTYTLPPSFLFDENLHTPLQRERLSAPVTPSLPAEWNTLQTIQPQAFINQAATIFSTPQLSSVRTEDPMDCSEMTAQTTTFANTPFNSSNTSHTELSSAHQIHSGQFIIFGQDKNNLRFISKNSNLPFNSTISSEWNVSPATPKHLFPSSPTAHFHTPAISGFTTEDPMDCSEIDPQTTSFSNPTFNSFNTTRTQLPFARPTPPNPFNAFSKSVKKLPVSSTSSSMLKSNNIFSAAPMEVPGVPQEAKSWTRPFLKAKKKTPAQPRSAATALHSPFIFSQSTNTPCPSQFFSSSSPFTSNSPATRHFPPTTPPTASSSSSAANFPIAQRTRFPTPTPSTVPNSMNPFAASPLSQDLSTSQQPRVTILPKNGRRRRSGADY